jgi:hypothetical protein
MTSGSLPEAAADVRSWLYWSSAMPTSLTLMPLSLAKAAAILFCAAMRSGRFSSVHTVSCLADPLPPPPSSLPPPQPAATASTASAAPATANRRGAGRRTGWSACGRRLTRVLLKTVRMESSFFGLRVPGPG